MQQDRESQVRQRAHAIWLEEGMPEGQSEQHWNRAQSEIDADDTAVTEEPAAAPEPVEPAAATPEVGSAPEFQNPDPVPVPPDVEAITDPASARATPATKKQTRRKVKPVTPVR